jgi:hypothetical protein
VIFEPLTSHKYANSNANYHRVTKIREKFNNLAASDLRSIVKIAPRQKFDNRHPTSNPKEVHQERFGVAIADFFCRPGCGKNLMRTLVGCIRPYFR